MTLSVEQLCESIGERRLLPSAELARLRARWFQSKRADVNDVDKFGHWMTVNGYLTPFSFRMLRDGKGHLLQLNQYQLTDHLSSGPFAGAFLAVDPLHRRVVLEVLAADKAANPEAVQAFQTAAERAMTVRHANVNLTLDFGQAQGRHYLVREFYEGETLADILAQRGKLKPLAAARLFALALLGLQALHEKQVPAGPLGPESLLLSIAGKGAGSKARTVKILNAGVPRTLFDPAALDAAMAPAASAHQAPPPDLRAPSTPREDLFRLGVTFYRSLTGQAPFSPEAAAAGTPHATPIRSLAPEVPEILAQLVESMIAADPAHRPGGAAQVAKGLRIFLASEEEGRQDQPEEQLIPHPAAPVATPAQEEPADASDLADAAEPRASGDLAGQLKSLWGEIRPGQRDWVFLSIGAAAVVLIVLFLTLLTGIHFVNLVCLLTGGALSFFVERLLRLREGQPEGEG
jgi:serine/threonine protein kinase